jgi:hypothetical protein
MATATAALEPISPWDADDPVTDYSTRAAAAGSVAWAALTHSQTHGPDIARIVGPEGNRSELPAGADAEDVYQFLYDLIQDAAEIGYATAQVELSGFGPAYGPSKVRTGDLARAVAALLRMDLIEDGQTFDPKYREAMAAAARSPIADGFAPVVMG